MSSGITLSLIAKDEEDFLPRCLASVRNLVDAMIVVDTGSTDDTVARAEAAGAIVLHVPWQNDFAAARNAGLAGVRTPWVLVLDADEELLADDRPALLDAVRRPTADAYNLRIVSLADRPEDLSEARVTRLFRAHPAVRWTGAVHEQIIPSVMAAGMRLGQVNVRLLHYGYLGAVAAARQKAERNLALLEAQVRAEPHNPYALWQRAQTYLQVGRADAAIADARRASALLPTRADLQPLIWITWARAQWMAGHADEANRTVNRALERWRDSPDFWYLRGQLAMARQEWAAAQGAFEHALALGDTDHYLQTDTGVGSYKALWQLVRIALAQQDARRATATALLLIRRQPHFRPAWQTLLSLLAGTPLSVVVDLICQQVPAATVRRVLTLWPDPTPDEAAVAASVAAILTGKESHYAVSSATTV